TRLARRALLPGFAKIAHDAPRARAAFVKAAAVMTLFSMPIAFGIAATAPLIGEVILGPKWLAAVPLMQLLALAGVVTAIASPITSALIAMGKPYVVASLSLCNAVVLLSLVLRFAWQGGALGAAQAVLLTALIFLPVYFAISMRFLYVSVRDILTIVLRPAMAAILMYWLVTKCLRLTGLAPVDILLAAGIGAVIYVTTVLLLWRIMPAEDVCAESFILERIRERLAARGLIRNASDGATP
ncbi:MAG: polysaccharide biosynthesis C-terminal domain-containing protein, partial [Gammaproteobacteria bacterium]